MTIAQSSAQSVPTPPIDDIDDIDVCLAPTEFLDFTDPKVMEYAQTAVDGATGPVEAAVRLFYKVRDGIRYNPYSAVYERDAFKASAIVGLKRSFCVPKAILLAATGRAVGIPSRLGFGDVRNHLASEKLTESMGTDIFVFHGFAEFYLNGKWLKATPAFNIEMCDRFGVKALEFDGKSDALFHEYDQENRRHMEYIRYRGSFVDFPYETMFEAFREVYGYEFAGNEKMQDFRTKSTDDAMFE